jgi:hypothetical protein
VIVTFSLPSASAVAGLATSSIASAGPASAPASPDEEDEDDEDEDEDEDDVLLPEEEDEDEDELPELDPASESGPPDAASSSPHPMSNTGDEKIKKAKGRARRMTEEYCSFDGAADHVT